MKKISYTLGLLVFISSSCNDFEQGTGDFFYKFHRNVPGIEIQENDIIAWTAVERTQEDSITHTWYNSGTPALFKCEKPVFQGDLFSALSLLSEGDSATFKISIDSLVAHTGRSPVNLKGKYLFYDIKINKVFHKKGMTDGDIASQVDHYLTAELEKLKAREAPTIDNYIRKNNLEVKETNSGLMYTLVNHGEGRIASMKDTIVVNYTGMLANGKVFDTTDEKVARRSGIKSDLYTFNKLTHPFVPLKIPLGHGRAVAGFEEALLIFPKGSKVILIVPSKLAFNEVGEGEDIVPYTPLIYYLEIVDILRENSYE